MSRPAACGRAAWNCDALVALHEVERHGVGEQPARLDQRQVEALAQLAGQRGGQLGVEARQRADHVVGPDARQAQGALLAERGKVDETARQARQGARLGPPVGLVGSLFATGKLPASELL